jgi:hypothetical protein
MPLAVLLALSAPAAGAAEAPKPDPAKAPLDDLRLGFVLCQQVDRLNPGSASSENSTSTGSIAMGADLDFRVAVIPATKKGPNPSVGFGGRILASERAIAEMVPIPGDTLGRDSIEIVPAARTIELSGSVRVAYPVHVVGGQPVTSAYLKAEVTSLFARDTRGGLIDSRTYAIGFERLTGTFAGSFIDLGYGSDGTFGSAYGGGRYKVHVYVQGAISPATSPRRGNVAAFAEIELNSDNQGGPDGLRALVGFKLDSDGVLRGVSGFLGGLLGT